jgi:hypothetical protein
VVIIILCRMLISFFVAIKQEGKTSEQVEPCVCQYQTHFPFIRGANWLWCGAPPNLFSSIICTTSAQFWRSSTNNWGGLEVHLTVTPLQSYLSSYSFLVGLQEECYYCILERESKSDAGWTQNECKNIFLYHSEVWNLDFAFSKDQNACHAHC